MQKPPEPVCTHCGLKLEADETYCCQNCADWFEMTDPNFKIAGEDDDG